MRLWPTKDETTESPPRGFSEPVPLPADHVACQNCGIAVPTPAGPRALIHAEATHGLAGPRVTTLNLHPVPMTRCQSCLVTLARAADLMTEHPAMRARLGDAAAVHLTESALAALSILDVPLPPPGTPVTAPEISSLIRHLGAVGAGARWLSRFAPVREADAHPDTCSPHPWAHVRESNREPLRSSYAKVLSERIAMTAPPVRLTPPMLTPNDLTGSTTPAHGACLFCGIGAVTMPAPQVARAGGRKHSAADVWTLRKVSPSSIGGRPSPARLVGHTCPACTAAVEKAGTPGPTALDLALADFIGAAGRWNPERDMLDGLLGWGVLAARAARAGTAPPEPNATPWAHVSGLDALAERLAVST